MSTSKKPRFKPAERVWRDFQENAGLSDKQLEQFKTYEVLLSEYNTRMNLTAIIEVSAIVRQHFQDSLALKDFVDMSKIKGIVDVGAGAGFPAIPLKILFPHLKVLLIEVTKKKVTFLEDVIASLGLTDIEFYTNDWRTFIRKTTYDLDFFVTRAALNDLELMRLFKPSSPYKNSTLVYWVSKDWEVHPKAAALLHHEERYKLGARERRLAFFKLPA